MIKHQPYIENQSISPSIEMLMRRYQQPLYRFCMHLCRSQAEADDLFQDVWLRVIKHLDTQGEMRLWESWLFTIAVNLYRDRYRKAKRWPPELIQHTQTRIKRRGLLSMLLMIVIWSSLIQLTIGAVLIAVTPDLQKEWIWRMLLLTEASFLIIQCVMIWGLRNREELPSLGEVRSILRGGHTFE